MAGFIGTRASVVSSGAERKQHYNITTTTTSLTGLQYTPTKVHVYHNGIRLVDGTDYTATNGTSITLTNAAEDGDDVVVVSYATFQVSDTVSAANGGTFAGNVTVSGDLNTSTVLPSSDDAKDLGTSAKRFQDAYLSGGVYLGGTGSANKLDDYETGSASMTWVGTGGTNTAAGTLYYRKIGDIVFCSFTTSSVAITATGTLKITGLPFACNGSVAGGGSVLYRNKNEPSGAHTLVVYIRPNQSQIELWWNSNASYAQLNSSHFDNGTFNDFYMNFQYMTTL